MKYGTNAKCSHQGCTFDHSKLKSKHDHHVENSVPGNQDNSIGGKKENVDTKSDSEDDFIMEMLNDKDDRHRRSDSGMDKSINDSVATTNSSSGFVEIESSQKDNSKENNVDISFNSTNNADDEEEEDDNIPSLAMDSDDDDDDWDKCSSSTKERTNVTSRLTESSDIGDGNDFEMIKSPADDDTPASNLDKELLEKKNLTEEIQTGNKDAGKTKFLLFEYLKKCLC